MTGLIAAYTAWDTWAGAVSKRAAAAIAAGQKPTVPGARWGERVAIDLIYAEDLAARPLGISGRQLHDRIVTGRRNGLTITQAITQAVTP